MKITKIFAITMAAIVGMTACSKEDGNNHQDDKMSLIVYLPNAIDETRSVEAPGTTTTPTFANGIVYLLNYEAVVQTLVLDNDDIVQGYVHFEQVPATVNTVAVVANVYAQADIDALKLSTDLNDIEKYPFTISSQSDAGFVTKALFGKTSTFTTTTNPGAPTDTHIYKTAEVTMNAITARFEFDGNVTAGVGVRSVNLEGVWFNNFPLTNAATSPTLYPSSDTSWNIDPAANPAGSASPIVPITTIPPYAPTQYHDPYNSTVNGTDFVYAYQLFAGNYVPHMILLVSGQYDDNDYFLGWLTYDKFNENLTPITQVENNMIYRISGAVCNKADLTDKPELEKFDLGVKCIMVPWTEKNVTPGIQ